MQFYEVTLWSEVFFLDFMLIYIFYLNVNDSDINVCLHINLNRQMVSTEIG